jgi:hypothetical protein
MHVFVHRSVRGIGSRTFAMDGNMLSHCGRPLPSDQDGRGVSHAARSVTLCLARLSTSTCPRRSRTICTARAALRAQGRRCGPHTERRCRCSCEPRWRRLPGCNDALILWRDGAGIGHEPRAGATRLGAQREASGGDVSAQVPLASGVLEAPLRDGRSLSCSRRQVRLGAASQLGCY